jgi:hypothetical protein
MPMLMLGQFAIWITGQIDISGSKLYQQFWEFYYVGVSSRLCMCVVTYILPLLLRKSCIAIYMLNVTYSEISVGSVASIYNDEFL